MLDRSVLAQCAPGPVGVAVSGGGDSVALLLLLNHWARQTGVTLTVATVDHGLRAQSGAEAEWVAALCRVLGLPHTTLLWKNRVAQGNLSAQARDARRQLLAEWISGRGGSTVFLGHTRDDVAETFLMRLARGSGLDGLSAMQPVLQREGVTWLRPLLSVGREALRSFLHAHDQHWIDDPTNEDDRFERARMRKALVQLSELGIDAPTLSATAERLSKDRDVLAARIPALARSCLAQTQFGEIQLSRPVFMQASQAEQLRLMRAIFTHFNGAAYAPRQAQLDQVLQAVRDAKPTTLAGVQSNVTPCLQVFFREYSAIAPPMIARPYSVLWDSRWDIWSDIPETTIAALGVEGLRQCGPRPKNLRANVALTLPAIWRKGEVIATPVLRPDRKTTFRVRHFAGLGATH